MFPDYRVWANAYHEFLVWLYYPFVKPTDIMKYGFPDGMMTCIPNIPGC